MIAYILSVHVGDIDIPAVSGPWSDVEFTGLNVPRPIGVVQFAWSVWRHRWDPKQASGWAYQNVGVLVVLVFDAKFENIL